MGERANPRSQISWTLIRENSSQRLGPVDFNHKEFPDLNVGAKAKPSSLVSVVGIDNHCITSESV